MSNKNRKKLIDDLDDTNDVSKKFKKFLGFIEIECDICKDKVTLLFCQKTKGCPSCGNTIQNPSYIVVNPYSENDNLN